MTATPECLCGKRRYATRKIAKHAAHSRTIGHRMSPYRCPTVPGIWHYGHQPRSVANGTISKDEWLDRMTRP